MLPEKVHKQMAKMVRDHGGEVKLEASEAGCVFALPRIIVGAGTVPAGGAGFQTGEVEVTEELKRVLVPSRFLNSEALQRNFPTCEFKCNTAAALGSKENWRLDEADSVLAKAKKSLFEFSSRQNPLRSSSFTKGKRCLTQRKNSLTASPTLIKAYSRVRSGTGRSLQIRMAL